MIEPTENMDEALAAATEMIAEIPKDEQLKQVGTLARLLLVAARRIELIEEDLAGANEIYRKIEEKLLPEQLMSLGLQELRLDNGVLVQLKDFVSASLDKDQLQAAVDWLRGHGLGDLIKNVVSVAFGKGEDDKANMLLHMLSELELPVENKKNVHPQSLNAAIKEHLSQGKTIDSDAIRVYQGTVAKLKLPKNTTLKDILGE